MKTLATIFFFFVFLVQGLWAQTGEDTVMHRIDSLIELSRFVWARSETPDSALALNRAAEQLARSRFGPESRATGRCLQNLGDLLAGEGDLPGARDAYMKARSCRGTDSGPPDSLLLDLLTQLASVYADLGETDNATAAFEEALDVCRQIHGDRHVTCAELLNSLAIHRIQTGTYDIAHIALRQAREIMLETEGRESGGYVRILNNLALLAEELSYFEESEDLYEELLDLEEAIHGKDSENYCQSLFNLATLHHAMGNFDASEAAFLEARDRMEVLLGPDHPGMANYLNNLGNLYVDLGNYTQAEELYLRARSLAEIDPGPNHPQYAGRLENLARIYHETGDFAKEGVLLREALDLKKRTLGDDHPAYAYTLGNLSLVYMEEGRVEESMALIREEMDVLADVFGRDHPAYAGCLVNLGQAHSRLEQWEVAEQHYLEAQEIYSRVFTEGHPDLLSVMMNLAEIAERQGQSGIAESLFAGAVLHQRQNLGQAVSFLSETELEAYSATFRESVDILFHYCLRRLESGRDPGQFPGLLADQALFYKGFLLTAVRQRNARLLQVPEIRETLREYRGYQRRLAALHASPDADREIMARLEENINVQEKEMARHVAGMGNPEPAIHWEDISGVLAPEELALEFMYFRDGDIHWYAALLIFPGTRSPVVVPLCRETELEGVLPSGMARKSDYVNQLYAQDDRGLIREAGDKPSLYSLIWEPLFPYMQNTQTIYMSAAGLLLRVNHGAISILEDEVVSDRVHLVNLNSTRQITEMGEATPVGPGGTAAVFGGVEFEAEPALADNRDKPMDGVLHGGQRSETSGQTAWTYLKWTDREGVSIAEILDQAGFHTRSYRGREASEEKVKEWQGAGQASPTVLHLATHGYFFPDPVEHGGFPETATVYEQSVNPLVRSGLILANGNYAWRTGHALPGREDGILTAYEISQLNLANTELVVLSACETGLGDIQGNEGVYGLQRAFKIAGAKYLIMSLWQVPDRETMQFMTTFYRNWLEPEDGNKMSIPEAFRKTQLEMRDRFFNPYSWAGFVLVE